MEKEMNIYEVAEFNKKVVFDFLKSEWDKHFCAIQKSFEEVFEACEKNLKVAGVYKSVHFDEVVEYCKEQGFTRTGLFNGIENGKVFNYIILNK